MKAAYPLDDAASQDREVIMPHCLIAGVVCSKPKADLFPERGLPRCSVNVRVIDETGKTTWPLVGYDMLVSTLETLEVGDSVAGSRVNLA